MSPDEEAVLDPSCADAADARPNAASAHTGHIPVNFIWFSLWAKAWVPGLMNAAHRPSGLAQFL